ncbi:hypothetical protein [Pararobbsia silviterrae]|uniref:hypothetical protein n=1 Tax=Pararobbsia silviterrae TaxID=1792498 RepID=UPI0011C36608|nr:hypothetical protein [Pararobbsia silviterrae]
MKATWPMLLLFAVQIGAALQASAQAVSVPFVGCASDGQLGHRPAPRASKTPQLPAAVASRLAWYSLGDVGVLGPRGWTCFGYYGSAGTTLVVIADTSRKQALHSDEGIRGDAIQWSTSYGQTSGRFEAAKIAARLFPERKAFVDTIIDEGVLPREAFDNTPFPHDRIRRFGSDQVSFETAPHENGLGTMSRLASSDDPIDGMASMNDDNDVTLLVVRVDAALRDLVPAILGVELPN